MPKSSGQGNWVTINGVHVLIDGNKKIIKGPKNLLGMTPRQAIGLDPTDNKSSAKSEKSPASKAMAKAKSDREVESSKKKKSDGLVERAKRQTAKSASDTSAKQLEKVVKDYHSGNDSAEIDINGVKVTFKTDNQGDTYAVIPRSEGKALKVYLDEYYANRADFKKGKTTFYAQDSLDNIIKAIENRDKPAPKKVPSYFKHKDYEYADYKGDRDYPVDIDFAPRHNPPQNVVLKNSSKTGNSNFDNATSTTKAKVAKNPNNRLHTGRVSSKGDLTPKQHKLFIQYVGSSGKGMSGNEALKIAISGKIPAVTSTSSRQSNSARVSNAKTRGEFLRAVHDPVITARTRKRGR